MASTRSGRSCSRTHRARTSTPSYDAVGRLSRAIDAVIEDLDGRGIDTLRSAWWQLEYVDAMVLSSGREVLSPAEVSAASRARDEFLALLDATRWD